MEAHGVSVLSGPINERIPDTKNKVCVLQILEVVRRKGMQVDEPFTGRRWGGGLHSCQEQFSSLKSLKNSQNKVWGGAHLFLQSSN